MVRKIFHEIETGVQLEDDKGGNYISLPVTGFDNGWITKFFFIFFSIDDGIFLSYFSNYSSDYQCYWSNGRRGRGEEGS